MEETILKLSAEIEILKKMVRVLQQRVIHLEQEGGRSQLEKVQLLRVKNQEELSDQYLLDSTGYLDLSPDKAFEMYNNKNIDFVLLDVSVDEYTPFKTLKEAKNIPLEELENKIHELPSKKRHFLVISERGARSILACKILNEYGYYHLSHISGGYKFWPGFRLDYDRSDFDDFLREA